MTKNRNQRQIDLRHLMVGSILLVLLIPFLAITYLRIRTPEIEQETFHNLEAIAKLQSDRIDEWLKTQRLNIDFLSRSHFSDFASSAIPGKNTPAGLREERRHIEHFRKSFDYEFVAVYNSQFEAMVADGAPPWASEETKSVLGKIWGNGEIATNTTHVSNDNKTSMIYSVPLGSTGASSKEAKTYLIVVADLDRHIFEELQEWPSPNPSGNTLLIAREGDEIVILNRPRNNTPPQFSRYPLERKELPGVRAILDNTSEAFISTDYRGVTVLSANQPIQGTPWYLSVRIDRDDVLAPMWNSIMWVVGTLVCAALLMIALLALAWNQRKKTQEYLLRAEQIKLDQILQRFFDLPFIGMVIVSVSTRRFLRFNDKATELTGYSRDELFEKGWKDLTHPDDYLSCYPEILKLIDGKTDSVEFEQRLVRKDGSIIYVNADVKSVRNAKGEIDFLIGTAEDITEQKMHAMAMSVANQQLKANQTVLQKQNDDLQHIRSELEQSRQRYINLYEFAPSAYLTLSPEGKVR